MKIDSYFNPFVGFMCKKKPPATTGGLYILAESHLISATFLFTFITSLPLPSVTTIRHR